MPIARSTNSVFDYVCLEDRDLPAEEQTVFQLRTLTSEEHLRASDIASMGGGRATEYVLRVGIAGWSNLHDAEGNLVPCQRHSGKRNVSGISVKAPLTTESLNRLPASVLEELGAAIMEGNTVSDEDVGN